MDRIPKVDNRNIKNKYKENLNCIILNPEIIFRKSFNNNKIIEISNLAKGINLTIKEAKTIKLRTLEWAPGIFPA